MRILPVLLSSLPLAMPVVSQAATFKVFAQGAVTAVIGSSATSPVDIAVGAQIDLSFLVTDDGPAGYEVSPTKAGEEIRYLSSVSGLTGTLAGQAITSRAPASASEQANEFVQITNDLPLDASRQFDRLIAYHNIGGFSEGGFDLSQFRFNASLSGPAGSDGLFTETALTADRFSQSVSDLDSLVSSMVFIFGSPTDPNQRVTVKASLDFRSQPIAPVPLPAPGALLIAGLACLYRRNRSVARCTSDQS